MQIKAFSKKLNIPVDTIRYYEKLGLLQPQRGENGYRLYDEACMRQLKMIVVLKQLGFSLEEIGQLTNLKQQEISAQCNNQSVALFEQKIQQLTEQIAFYKRAIEALQLAQNLMGKNQYAANQMQLEKAIDALFQAVKKAGGE